MKLPEAKSFSHSLDNARNICIGEVLVKIDTVKTMRWDPFPQEVNQCGNRFIRVDIQGTLPNAIIRTNITIIKTDFSIGTYGGLFRVSFITKTVESEGRWESSKQTTSKIILRTPLYQISAFMIGYYITIHTWVTFLGHKHYNCNCNNKALPLLNST